jgi:cell division protein FtsW
MDPDKMIKRLGLFLFVFFLFVLAVMHFLPESMVTSTGGAKRWIRVGFSIAPVEFFKIGFIYFLAWSFTRKIPTKQFNTFKEEFMVVLPYISLLGLVIFLISVMQNDLGQVVLLAIILFLLLLYAGGTFRFFISAIALSFFVAIGLILDKGHRIDRVIGWWSTTQDFILSFLPMSIANTLRVDGLPPSYQVSRSLDAIHNGGIFGVGFGNGHFKYGYLSDIHTDFVLSGIIEEFGLIGIIVVSISILFITHRVLRVANRVKEKEYYLFSMGVSLLIIVSFLLNAFGISGLIPIKGIAVPFFSYGGSSMLSLSIAIGMILCISKKNRY